jgi:PAS domain S-box-containing protein
MSGDKTRRPHGGGKDGRRASGDGGPITPKAMTTRMLAAIFQSSDAAIISKTLDGIVTSWNIGAERMFATTAEEIIGRPIHLIASPDHPSQMRDILDRIGRGERVVHTEIEQRRKDGTLVQFGLTVWPIRDEAGKAIGALTIIHDITDRKRVEAELKAKSEQLEEFVHALDLVPALVRTVDGRILLWGRGLQALYGWSAEAAIGRQCHELLASEPPQPMGEIHAELLRTDEWRGELQQRHRDGHRIVVASQWALRRDQNGLPVSVLEVNQDMTERRGAQSMLEEREARLRSVLETAPDAIITIDERGIIQSFSNAAERLFGYAAGEVIGRNVKLLMPPGHNQKHDNYLRRYRRTGEKRIIGIGRQVEARRKDGSIFPIELAVGEMVFGDTRIFTGFIRDITTRTRMEQDLRQAQKMEAIGQLTGGLAHDFNNLLTVILGNLEMLEPRLDDVDSREIMADAREATELGAQLASRLLAFGRRQPLAPKPIDLNVLVVGMIDLLRRTLGTPVRIETRLAADLPITLADFGQVENALLNLAINARDAMPDGGSLLVETGWREIGPGDAATRADIAPGLYVMLAVTDTGGGMSPEIQQRAFEPFFTTKPAGVGSGLGLSMVYGFVKQSGGHIELSSDPGHGTTVRIYLPARSASAEASEPRTAAPVARSMRVARVLVVEDDARVRRISVRRLKQLGYAIIEADSGSAALLVLDRGEPIDVLFTDVVMSGGMNGLDLARAARLQRPALKILLTSGFAEPSILEAGLPATNAGWLGKPYTIDQLDARLRALLND